MAVNFVLEKGRMLIVVDRYTSVGVNPDPATWLRVAIRKNRLSEIGGVAVQPPTAKVDISASKT